MSNPTNLQPASHYTTNQRGYTLIELLIAVTIFATVMGITLAIFLTNSRVQSKTQAVRDTSQAARYMIEAIGREVQLADGCDMSNSDLALRHYPLYTDQGLLVLFKTQTDKSTNISKCVMHSYYADNDSKILKVEVNNDFYNNSVSSESKTLNPTNITVNEIIVSPQTVYNQDFYTSPDADPNTGKLKLDRQPSIQISLTVTQESKTKRQAEESTQTIRTAFTTRNYPGFNDISQ